jgi:hypothetical protein
VSVADEHDRVGAQRDELPDAQPGAQQDLADDPDQQPALSLGGAQELRRVGVVEGLGQLLVLPGQVTGDDRDPRGGVSPAPLLDADEEHAQGPEAVSDRVHGHPSGGAPGSVLQPGLEVLDVLASDRGNSPDLGVGFGEERREAPQRLVCAAHAARSQRAGDLLEVAAHGGDHDWAVHGQLVPVRHPQRAHRRAPAARGWGWSAKTWASMTSAARRYWAASQSSPRCR